MSLSTKSFPLVSNRTTTIATLISIIHKARSLQCKHHTNTLKRFTENQTMQGLVLNSFTQPLLKTTS